jgi:GDP-L-fucose synthase
MEKNSRIFLSGHTGLLGSSLLSLLQSEKYTNIITITHKDLDLCDQQSVKRFMRSEKPEYVFMCSAHCGGIQANINQPVEFLYENMMMEFNIIKYSFQNYVKKLLLVGSNCIYPTNVENPIKEEYLSIGNLEKTNEGFALSKISGIKLCEYYNKEYGTDYICPIFCNLYGENDKYDLTNSHLVSALINKIHYAKINNISTVELWGTGTPRREYMYVSDAADALLFLMNNYDSKNGLINVGSGIDYSILDIANKIKEITGYTGQFVFDTTKPDGIKQKLLDSSKLTSLGWKPKIEFEEGLRHVYKWYESNYQET